MSVCGVDEVGEEIGGVRRGSQCLESSIVDATTRRRTAVRSTKPSQLD